MKFCFLIVSLIIFLGELIVKYVSQDDEWTKLLNDHNEIYSNRPLIKEMLDQILAKHSFLTPNLFHVCIKSKFQLQNQPRSDKINFFFEVEHTLVTDGGKTIPPGTSKGNIATYDKTNAYLVRIECVECYKSADIVVDYSSLNMENIRTSGVFNDDFVHKSTYAPAIPFPYDPYHKNHSQVLLNTAYSRSGGRRSLITNQIFKVLGRQSLSNMYFETLPWFMEDLDNVKILVNVHATDFDHTLEEFRILPALLRGVVVVSEWVPLHHLLPYKDYIIFETFDKLVEKVVEVVNNYDSYRDKFFGPRSKLNETIHRMKETALHELERRVLERYHQLNISQPQG